MQLPARAGTQLDHNSQRPTVYVDIVVTRCASLETGRDLQWNSVKTVAAGLGAVSLPPVVPRAFQGQGSPVTGGRCSP